MTAFCTDLSKQQKIQKFSEKTSTT